MGTGSVESLVLRWLGRLPTVPVPFFGALASTVKKGDRHLAAAVSARIRPVSGSEPVPLFHSRLQFE